MFDFIPSAGLVIGSVIAGLTVAAVLAYFRRRRLYVVVPKLFSFSELSAGQTIELTILNRGARTEEAIEVHLTPNLSYTILASTLPSITIDNSGIVRIARLPKGEEVSVILTVEKGLFTQESVLSISSKEAKGEVKKKIEESQEQSPAATAFALAFIFIVMPTIGYLAGNLFEDEVLPNIYPEVASDSARRAALEAEGWEGVERYLHVLQDASNDESWPVTVGFPEREGSLLRFTVSLSNPLQDRIEARVSVSTQFDPHEYIVENRRFPNSIESGILILPGQSTTRTLEAVIPFAAKEKVAIFDFGIETGGKHYFFKYVWHFRPER